MLAGVSHRTFSFGHALYPALLQRPAISFLFETSVHDRKVAESNTWMHLSCGGPFSLAQGLPPFISLWIVGGWSRSDGWSAAGFAQKQSKLAWTCWCIATPSVNFDE